MTPLESRGDILMLLRSRNYISMLPQDSNPLLSPPQLCQLLVGVPLGMTQYLGLASEWQQRYKNTKIQHPKKYTLERGDFHMLLRSRGDILIF